MNFSGIVKEKIARVIGEFFTTNQIVNVFDDANIPTDRELYAKWRIILDAFSKMSDQEAAIPYILSVFCHPLHFQDPQFRSSFIEKLNTILAYENLEIKATDHSAKMFLGGVSINSSQSDIIGHTKTSIDYVTEAINFFKNEYNKARMSGLTYEYSLGENINSHEIENGREGYEERLKAIGQLKDVGFITAYTVEARAEGDEYSLLWGWDYVICKIDESKITQKETLPATETKINELIHKIEITAMPDLQIRNVEDNTITKGKKRVYPPKFKPTDWTKITIRFLDDRNVLINADKKEQVVSDYEALGFADDKRNKPNMAWAFFRGLAQNNGETKQLPTPIPDNIKQQKRQLSDRLKTIFKNDTDPFYDPTEKHTYKIKIKLIPPESENKTDKFGVQEYLKETMTEEYEEYR